MSKAVLISIHPKWCELIASGKKTVEVRKTRPKIELPFKCYIYETEGKTEVPTFIDEEGNKSYQKSGRVIGEFVCDKFDEFVPTENGVAFKRFYALHEAALSVREIREYLNGKRGYGWHISKLKIYNTPKELNAFHYAPERFCEKGLCGGCPYDQSSNEYNEYDFDCEWKRPLLHAPQSWCYVEKVGD